MHRAIRSLHVRNITDIDDKIIARAAENGRNHRLIHHPLYSTAMHEDADALGVIRPDVEPKATEHVAQMIAMIERLIANGKAYAAENGDVYYAVREFPAYGQLSGKSLDDLRAGERVEVDSFKRDPLDFVLWKAAKPNEADFWPSPWATAAPAGTSNARPWANNYSATPSIFTAAAPICSFRTDENEIAQSCGAQGHCHTHEVNGKLIDSHVKYWLHNGFIRVDNEKCPNRWAISSPSAKCCRNTMPKWCVSLFCARITAARSIIPMPIWMMPKAHSPASTPP